jgi:diguanylate cyclase (GGDEF)-like protein
MEDHDQNPSTAQGLLRILIYEESVEVCEEILAAIRGAGYAVKAAQAKDPTQLDKALSAGRWDVIIASSGADDARLQAIAGTVAGAAGSTPLLMAVGTLTTAALARALRSGARQVLALEDTDCIRLAVDQVLPGRGTSSNSVEPAATQIPLAVPAAGTAGGHDLLTGLYSHQYLMEIFDGVAEQAPDAGCHNALLYVTLDRFEDLHRDLGEAGSGLIISELGNLIRLGIDAGDIPVRTRDATFAVLTRNKSREQVDQMAKALLESVRAREFETPGRVIHATFSIGVGLFGHEECTLEHVMSQAALACEVAQGESGGQFHVYDDAADAKLRSARESGVEHQIRTALQKGRFRMVFQPIVNLHATPGENYEILLRMLDDHGHEMLPGEFMSAATQANLMPEIDRWVIRSGLERLKERQGQLKETRFFIKLDPQTLADGTFLPWLSQQLRDSRVTGDRLVFEVSEACAAKDASELGKAIAGLCELHCKVALEHVGRSSDALSIIKDTAVDYIKIDGSLTHDLSTNEPHQIKVKTLIENARATGKRTIVAFVEDARSLSFLWRWGADFIQGHYVQRPDAQLQYSFEEP